MLTRTSRNASAKDHLLTRGITLWRCIADDYEQSARQMRERQPTPGRGENRRVNRHTVRRAMAELAARGLVRSERGSGTYVQTDKLDYRIGTRTRFSEIVAAAGHDAQGTKPKPFRSAKTADGVPRALGGR